MTPREAVQLTGYIQAHFPSQPINEYTPDALGELLEPYPAADCRAAVLTLSSRPGEGSRWCSPSDIAREVKRVRAKRIAEAGDLTPPRGLSDAEEREWLGWARKQIGDGVKVEVDYGELTQRNLPELRAYIQRGPVVGAITEGTDHE